ncbi:DUF4259 domain-containing protein [Microvirga sp. Mcv34]|uniref:DUF4259 domain-containing protein n=1 Tax=Microvirga sp. Mcv34 TaxID=2926016 RepID=UPI0021C8EA1E|nr:DUF4259 domain-containing protein [Microvirga sp. Mcv34]
MGAWGFGPFDNDEAGDWLSYFDDQGLGAVRWAIEAVSDQDYLEVTEGSMAIAAAAMLAALCDGNEDGIPREKPRELQRIKQEEKSYEILKQPAVQALDRVLAPDSEIVELWSETDKFSEWKQSVLDIQRRLT